MLDKLVIKGGKSGLAAPLVSKLADAVKYREMLCVISILVQETRSAFLKLTQTVMAGSAM